VQPLAKIHSHTELDQIIYLHTMHVIHIFKGKLLCFIIVFIKQYFTDTKHYYVYIYINIYIAYILCVLSCPWFDKG